MRIDLFDHNKTAYEAAVELLDREGKAAIVHPTGTGKSFIGFQLCADHEDENVLWLSPSKYIFETQLENLARTTDGELPSNITFLTYARLMMMDEAEIAGLKPAYIILDEFHCCGARMRGRGVQMLLEAYPKVPVLGLSATNVRYLDNQRDIAAELFDGNIASEITLGEAIVRGILNPPKYVMSIYKYHEDLRRYETRLRRCRNRAVRDEGERYLEALKRALEKADGLDDIFDRHMTDRTGKYIVFCANKEHMDEMMGHMEWFAKVDRIALAKRYLKEQNARYIPQDAVVDGVWIGKWLAGQRKALEAGLLTPVQKKMLEGIPLWTKSEMQWENAYALAAEYYEKHGNLDIPRRYVAANGYGLGSWVSYQKKLRSKGRLSERQIQRLDEIGFVWDDD